MFVLISSTLLFSVMSGNNVAGASTEEITRCTENGYCITLTKGEIRAEEGLCVKIPCSFTINHWFTPQQLVWTKCYNYKPQCDTVVDSDRSRGRVLLLDPDIYNRNCSIIINDLTMWDSGSFTFNVNGFVDGRGDRVTFPLRAAVSVKALSQKPIVMVPPLIEGQETSLTCTAPGLCPGPGPEITWTWRGPGHEDSHIPGNIILMTEKLTDVAQRHSSMLTFNPRAEHHGTDVTCKVSFNNGITTEKTVTLNVTPAAQPGEQNAALPWNIIAVVSLAVNVGFIILVIILWNTRNKVKPNQEDRVYMSLDTRNMSEYNVIARPPN